MRGKPCTKLMKPLYDNHMNDAYHKYPWSFHWLWGNRLQTTLQASKTFWDYSWKESENHQKCSILLTSFLTRPRSCLYTQTQSVVNCSRCSHIWVLLFDWFWFLKNAELFFYYLRTPDRIHVLSVSSKFDSMAPSMPKKIKKLRSIDFATVNFWAHGQYLDECASFHVALCPMHEET